MTRHAETLTTAEIRRAQKGQHTCGRETVSRSERFTTPPPISNAAEGRWNGGRQGEKPQPNVAAGEETGPRTHPSFSPPKDRLLQRHNVSMWFYIFLCMFICFSITIGFSVFIRRVFFDFYLKHIKIDTTLHTVGRWAATRDKWHMGAMRENPEEPWPRFFIGGDWCITTFSYGRAKCIWTAVLVLLMLTATPGRCVQLIFRIIVVLCKRLMFDICSVYVRMALDLDVRMCTYYFLYVRFFGNVSKISTITIW